jgi:hypothetical protein
MQQQPCSALRGDGQELQLYSDRVIVRNTGMAALLFGRGERTVLFGDIEDVFLYENADRNESLIKLSLRDEGLPVIMAYNRTQEAAAKMIRDFVDINVHHEGVRSISA